MTEFAQDRRLTCNRIFRHLVYYSQQGFSGRLDVRAADDVSWRIYIYEGKIVWATGGLHPRRRWRRQVRLVTGQAPDISRLGRHNAEPFWDYLELQQLARTTLSPDRVGEIVQGTLTEVLFDIVQAFELPLARDAAQPPKPLMPLSSLIGIGDGMQVIPVREPELPVHSLSSTWMPSALLLQKEAQAAWEQWVHLGLLNASPDSAPIIHDLEQLQGRVSKRAFHNLTALLNGNRTFRDIALKMKRSKDQFGAGSALAPYIQNGLVGYRTIGDVAEAKGPIAAKPAETPTIVCLDTVPRHHGMMDSLAAKVGCSYEAMVDDIEALYEISRPSFPKPILILVSESLAALSAADACKILRRVERLSAVPILVYAEESQDTFRIRKTLSAGATEYLCGEEFNTERLLALFEQYVATAGASSTSRETHQIQLTSPVEVTDLLPSSDREVLDNIARARQQQSDSSKDGTAFSRSTLRLDKFPAT